ncbi:MAG: TrkA family potassium uptake protein [Defluviitaleaceae bacterium]|nr:TrkA family potassium uptake protein [Defluviitaleaceae bacterium]
MTKKQKRKPRNKSILVIGMGRFGRHLAMSMQKNGNSVFAIDKEESIMQDLADVLENTMIADCTKESFLQTLGVSNYDICYVATGETFEATMLITSYLKRHGAKYIVTKASSDIHIELLKIIGADEVIYPERDMAAKTAIKHSNVGVIDYLPLSRDYSIFEIEVPPAWIGNNIVKLRIRQKYNVNVLLVLYGGKNKVVDAEYVFKEGDIVVLMGTDKDVLKLRL